jgi:glycosyltransferase involved in cell wall biosynthesis
LNIAYDISALGTWFDDPGGKRGIYRVVEELLNELSAHPEISITAVRNSDSVARYLLSREHKLTASFNRRKLHDLASRAAYQIISYNRKNEQDLNINRGLARRMSRFSSNLVAKAAGALPNRIPSVGLDNANVFHQPGRLPFPSYIRNYQRNGFTRFLTIYDFIPFDSRWHDLSEIHLLRKVYESLGPEDSVICISEHVRQQACEYLGLLPEKVFTAPLAASSHIFYPCSEESFVGSVRTTFGLGDTPYFLTLSAVEPRKNIKFLIETFAELVCAEPGMKANLVLAGSIQPLDFASVNKLIERLGISGRVILTGYVPNELLSPLYSGALAFVFPSLAEGFGLPPLEAMQCGLPVICANNSSLPQVVGNAGILFEATDKDELATAMLAIYSSEDLRVKYQELGILRAREFTWKRCADDHMKAYHAALAMQS